VRKRLTSERKWRISLELWRQGATPAELYKRCGITSRQLRRIQRWVRPSPGKDRALSVLRVVRDGLATSAFFVGVMLAFVLILSFYAFLPIQAANNWPTSGVAAILPLFIVGLGVGIFWLFEERRRKRLFVGLLRDGLLGWVSPILVAGFIFVLAVSVFAVASFVLHEWGALHLSPRSCAGCKVRPDDLFNFYTWHFLDAVPVLDINRSLRWEVPVTYSGAFTGWLVIAFKAAVIAPLIQAIRTYVQVRREVPRVRLRPWAWPRVARVGRSIKLSWSPTPPPPEYVFDVKVVRSGKGEHRWLKGTTTTSGEYTPHAPGTYRFRVECREQTSDEVLIKLETAGEPSRMRSRKVTVKVRPSIEGLLPPPADGR
jgi:hypothetical protein